MIIELLRTDFLKSGIFGELADEAGEWLLFTLEHSYFDENENVDAGGYFPKIPIVKGEYKCVRGTHQLKHGEPFETFEILGVKGHDNILFHSGNVNEDSDGCVLLGLTRDDDRNFITNSKNAFAFFMEQMKDVNEFKLIVT